MGPTSLGEVELFFQEIGYESKERDKTAERPANNVEVRCGKSRHFQESPNTGGQR